MVILRHVLRILFFEINTAWKLYFAVPNSGWDKSIPTISAAGKLQASAVAVPPKPQAISRA